MCRLLTFDSSELQMCHALKELIKEDVNLNEVDNDWWNEDFGRLLRVKVERCHSGISEVTSTHLHCLIDNFRCLK